MRFSHLVLAAALAAPLAAQPKPQYEIYAIRYATIPDFPVSSLVAGADRARKMDIAMMVWLVRGNGHNILVDSGFYREQFRRTSWNITPAPPGNRATPMAASIPTTSWRPSS